MRKSLSSNLLSGFTITVLLSMVPASATSITFSTGGVTCAPAGVCSSVAGAQTITFDGLGSGTTSPYTNGIATYSFSDGAPFVKGSVAGEYAAPPSDKTTYLSVGSPNKSNPVTITFSVPIIYFGLYLGSSDTYNTVEFYQGGALVGSFTGAELIPPGNGNQAVGDYLNFNVANGAADKIVMSSFAPALETDNHSFVAAPEPASIALVGLSLVALGICGFRCRAPGGVLRPALSPCRSRHSN